MKKYKDLKKGDVLVGKDGSERMVLSRRDDLVDVSYWNDFECYMTTYHYKEIEELGWTIEEKKEKYEPERVDFLAQSPDKPTPPPPGLLKEKWTPELHQTYWYIEDCGVTYSQWTGWGNKDYQRRYGLGVYPNREEAQDMYEAVCKFIKERNGDL